MLKKGMHMKIEIGRLQKLRDFAEQRKKTMTQLVEDWIDSLPDKNNEKSYN